MVRLKARYVLFEVLRPDSQGRKIEGKAVLKAVKSIINSHFGEFGIGQCQAMLALRYYNAQSGLGIIRIGRSQAPIVQGALTYIKEIGSQPVVIRVMHVSGTIKKCEIRACNLRKQELTSYSG